jgi:hypothetical protein
VKRSDIRNVVARAFAAEFPNDNSEIHAGTIWMSTEPCGAPVAHFAVPEVAVEVEVEVEVAAAVEVTVEVTVEVGAPEPDDIEPPVLLEETTEPIEIVDSIELEGPVEIVPAPIEVPVARAVPVPVPAPMPVEVAVEVAAEEIAASAEPEDGAADDDAYALFIRKLAEVAVASGATMDAASIDALLGTDAVATAWRAILRGESEDFSTCGGALDEWAAAALASMMSAPHKIAQIRRELRARGVAAFGLIEAA